jgi:enoyl-CoA hydratase/carnithine racemase
MMQDLDAAILQARFDPQIQVLVLTGNGDKFFCAGANIDSLAKADSTWKYYFCLHANETLLRLEHTPKLVIAALNGHCVGGGLEVALAADLRVARKGGAKIGLPEVHLGVLPGTGGTQRLTRLVGKGKAMELMVNGQNLTVEEAHGIGLVNQVFDGETFLDQVLDYARTFCTPGRAALAVGHIKRAVQSAGELSLEQGLALERELQAKLFASNDAAEGLAAYTGKRKPSFGGQ